LNDDLHEDSPIPAVNRIPLAEVLSQTSEHTTAFSNAVRHMTNMESATHAGHGSSPALKKSH